MQRTINAYEAHSFEDICYGYGKHNYISVGKEKTKVGIVKVLSCTTVVYLGIYYPV